MKTLFLFSEALCQVQTTEINGATAIVFFDLLMEEEKELRPEKDIIF